LPVKKSGKLYRRVALRSYSQPEKRFSPLKLAKLILANGVREGLSSTFSKKPLSVMARICAITGKRPTTGSIIHRKGQSKKSGGIGTHVTKSTKRKFRPNLQRIKVRLPSGQVKRMHVCVKAIKAGLVEKA